MFRKTVCYFFQYTMQHKQCSYKHNKFNVIIITYSIQNRMHIDVNKWRNWFFDLSTTSIPHIFFIEWLCVNCKKMTIRKCLYKLCISNIKKFPNIKKLSTCTSRLKQKKRIFTCKIVFFWFLERILLIWILPVAITKHSPIQ